MNFGLQGRAGALFFVLVVLAALGGTAAGGDEPFVGAANWGGTGLMEIPTARVMREGQWRIGAGQVHPYRYYYGAVSPWPGLELEGHITEVIDVPALTADLWKLPGQDRRSQIPVLGGRQVDAGPGPGVPGLPRD